jgi:uncharacterized protein
MPLLPTPAYRSPTLLFNKHLQTIVPSLYRKVLGINYQRQRLELPDGDFLDLDWHFTEKTSGGKSPLVIISHGLEGDSQRHYVLGMAKIFSENGFDILAWNNRSCSGEMNRLPRFYHHADTQDLSAVIDTAIAKGYINIILIGFSMGGSQTLRYLSERAGNVPKNIRKAVVFSVPVDLIASVKNLEKPENQIYEQRFIRKLKKKMHAKQHLLPQSIQKLDWKKIRHFRDFDNHITAPLHGFADAEDFYQKATVKPLLHQLQTSTLLVTAKNDPFFTPDCFPIAIAQKSEFLFLEIPEQGGHVGFALPNQIHTWSEKRALAFVS